MRKPTASRSRATRAARATLSATLAASLAFAAFAMTACSPAITNGGANDNEQGATNAAVSDMRINPIDLVTDEDPLKAFAANASMAVLNGQDADGSGGDPESFMEKNLCFSPVSLYLACSLLGAGTQGTAQSQLLTLLGAADTEALLAESQQVRQQLEETYGDAVIKVADSVWAGDGFAFTDSYLEDVQALGAGAFDVAFGSDEANRQISSWISDQTQGVLKPQISTEAGQAALLLSTIYFKDAWAQPFAVTENVVEPFKAPGFDVQANYMRQEVTDSQYGTGENYTAARLAFSGGSTMTFVRPNDDVMLYQLFQSAEGVQELLNLELDFQSVQWQLPKFQTDSSLRRLVEALRSLGVSNVFSPEEPDAFAPMLATDGGQGFCVSDVLQDTHLALDENGVEAAAYTAIGIEKMSLMPDAEPVEFKLDRPFFYYVTSPDGVVLFVGVLYNPNL